MATGGETSVNILDITSCSICLETFKEHKVLPCIHTFCCQCLDPYCKGKDPGGEITCPLCRTIFILPSGGVQNLSNNFFIHQLLQVNSAAVITAAMKRTPWIYKTALCELCSDTEGKISATSYCIKCDQHICYRCAGAHKRLKLFKYHQVVREADVPSSETRIRSAVSYCNQHPVEQNRSYCYDCKVVTCHLCFVDKHIDHKWTDVNKSAKEFCEQLAVDVNKFSECALRKQQKN